MSAIVLSMLSVFLFTGCEKDTAVAPQQNDNNIIDKFKRLKFQTVTTTSKDNGNFSNNSTKDNEFVKPGSSGDVMFAPSTGSNDLFTDPSSSDASFFGVNSGFGIGGGSFSFKGKTHNIAFGFCGTDLFSELDMNGELDQVDIFIGVAADNWTLESDGSSAPENGYIIYAISYNGSTNISNLSDFDGTDNINNMAFVLLIELGANENQGGEMYFSTSGNMTFSDSEVALSGVKMVDLDGSNVGTIDAILECVNITGYENEPVRPN